MRTVLTYDIHEDRARTRFYKRLKRYMLPVQRSVFEGRLTPKALAKVEALILRELNLEEDSVRIYFICANCEGLTRSFGVGPELPDPSEPILL